MLAGFNFVPTWLLFWALATYAAPSGSGTFEPIGEGDWLESRRSLGHSNHAVHRSPELNPKSVIPASIQSDVVGAYINSTSTVRCDFSNAPSAQGISGLM